MSDSYPTIQDSLSDVQKDFLGCVEMHLDPPEDDDPSYAVEAVFSAEDEAIRFALAVNDDDELFERRHTIEFVDPGQGRLLGWIRHSMKRVEIMNGRYAWTESRFEVSGPGVPGGLARQVEVEREVSALVDKVRVLDRSRTLRPAVDLT